MASGSQLVSKLTLKDNSGLPPFGDDFYYFHRKRHPPAGLVSNSVCLRVFGPAATPLRNEPVDKVAGPSPPVPDHPAASCAYHPSGVFSLKGSCMLLLSGVRGKGPTRLPDPPDATPALLAFCSRTANPSAPSPLSLIEQPIFASYTRYHPLGAFSLGGYCMVRLCLPVNSCLTKPHCLGDARPFRLALKPVDDHFDSRSACSAERTHPFFFFDSAFAPVCSASVTGGPVYPSCEFVSVSCIPASIPSASAEFLYAPFSGKLIDLTDESRYETRVALWAIWILVGHPSRCNPRSERSGFFVSDRSVRLAPLLPRVPPSASAACPATVIGDTAQPSCEFVSVNCIPASLPSASAEFLYAPFSGKLIDLTDESRYETRVALWAIGTSRHLQSRSRSCFQRLPCNSTKQPQYKA